MINDRDIKNTETDKILNGCQFTRNITINNKLGHLGHKHSITTTLIMIIISIYMINKHSILLLHLDEPNLLNVVIKHF